MLKLIKTTVLDASAASVTISNIPQEFKTLKLVMSARVDGNPSAWVETAITTNGTTSGFSRRHLYGSGSSAGSDNSSTTFAFWSNSSGTTASTFSNGEIVFPNYSSTSANKPGSVSSVTENNATGALSSLVAGLWSNTAAITSITLTPTGYNFVAGSTFYLYGIA